jgi:hypothetical protein
MQRIYALDAMNTGHAGGFWFESAGAPLNSASTALLETSIELAPDRGHTISAHGRGTSVDS